MKSDKQRIHHLEQKVEKLERMATKYDQAVQVAYQAFRTAHGQGRQVDLGWACLEGIEAIMAKDVQALQRGYAVNERKER